MPRLILVLSIGLLAVSSSSVLIKWCTAPALSIAAYRVVIAALTLVTYALINRRKWWHGLNKREWMLSFGSGFFLAIHFAAWITSLKLTSITNSVVLVTTSPFWVALASRFIFKTKLKKSLLFSFFIAFIGVLVMTVIGKSPIEQQHSLFGDFLALIGAWAAGGYILCGRAVQKTIGTMSYITIAYSFSGILLVVIAIIGDAKLSGFDEETYVLFVLIALIPQLLGHSSFNWSLKFLSAPLVSTLFLGEPVLASVMALIFLNEAPTMVQIFGGILVIAGVIGAIWSER